MAQGTHLQKITKKAQQIRKEHPQMKWTNAVKQASKMLSGNKTNKAMAKGKTVVVAGHKPATAHHPKKRRSVSGIKSHTPLMTVGKILVGSILGGSVGAIIYKKVPGTGLVKGGVQLALGGLAMSYIGEKKPFMFGLATGIGTGGGVNLMHTAGVINGLDEMVSGLFDGGINGPEQYREIPAQTAGNYQMPTVPEQGLHTAGYMGAYSQAEIDKWVFEGIPGTGGEDWK